MRNLILVLLVAVLAGAAIIAFARPGDNPCRGIQSGELSRWGETLTTGFNSWGYNYQGRGFNGAYCDYYRAFLPGHPRHNVCQAEFAGLKLQLRWNDNYLSNQDCNGDGRLDQHPGFATYRGSGAVLTATARGDYQSATTTCSLDYTIKLAAAPYQAVQRDNVWYDLDGKELGPVLWDEFIVVRESEKDPCDALDPRSLLKRDWPN